MATLTLPLGARRRIALPVPAVGAALVLLSLVGSPARTALAVGPTVAALTLAARALPRGPAAATHATLAVVALGSAAITRDVVLGTGGLLLGANAVAGGWGVNRGRSRRTGWAWRAATAAGAVLVALLVLYPTLLAVDYVGKPRRDIDGAALGLPHRDVRFASSDGVGLSGWLVPSRNGATVVVVHGGGGDRTGAVRHARMLAGAGYGVLLYDARGRGLSAGRHNAFGWRWHRDVRGAVDFLAARGVTRIGLLGLSTGAEAVVTEAADDPRVSAVVADGLQGRSLADMRALPGADQLQLVPLFGVLQAELRVVTGESPPAPLHDLVARTAATRPLLLVSTVAFERSANRAAASGTRATVWELPDVAHTAALAEHPRAYRARVLGTFASLR